MRDSPSFDRIVDTDDQTRGGFPVGRTFAEAVEQHIAPPPARVVELGVGADRPRRRQRSRRVIVFTRR